MRLLTFTVICLLMTVGLFGKKSFYFITVPNLLMVDYLHNFNIHTSVDLKLMIKTIHIPSQIDYSSPTLVIKKGLRSIPYYVPFWGRHMNSQIKVVFLADECEDSIRCRSQVHVNGSFINETYEIGLIDKNYIIFSETDKPIYKPGEKVKFRFMPIFPTNLLTEPDPIGPQREIILNSQGKYEILGERNLNDLKKFSVIIIENADGIQMAKWNNITTLEAMSLEYRLTPDPTFGQWKCKATFNEKEEILKFTVKKYVLPRFVVEVHPPSEILATDKVITFEVCAKYSTGKMMKADIVGSLCIDFIFMERKCRNFRLTLNKEDCVKISLKLEDFYNPNQSGYRFKKSNSFVNVTVTEEGTTSSVYKVVEGSGIMYTNYNIKFESRNYFKPGLPYFGRVRLIRHNNKPKGNSTVSITIGGYYGNNWGFSKNYTSDKDGLIHFTVPYIPVDNSVNLEITEQREPRPGMIPSRAYQNILNWESVDKQYLQIQPVKKISQCPGNLNLSIFTNHDISSVSMYAQILYRGKITKIKEFPPIPVKCHARDDVLGHYTCAHNDNIVCLPGWKGDNCREPICSEGCQNGACVEPNKCICKIGWKGKNCSDCVVSSNCKNGFCYYGNDCRCFPGWSGFDCSVRGPKIHQYDKFQTVKQTTTKPIISKKYEKQSIYERVIDVPLLKSMGPDIHIIVYFINENNEVVADSIEITEGLDNCSHLGGGDFSFDKNVALPKSEVILKIDSGTRLSSCAVRIDDIALSQFGKSSNADLSYLASSLIQINHKITLDKKNMHRYSCIPEKRPKRMIWLPQYEGIDSAKILSEAGFTTLTNGRIINSKCKWRKIVYYDSFPIPMVQSLDNNIMEKKIIDTELKIQSKIRDFFPESWIFSFLNESNKRLHLTVPDSMTTWKADSYCMTEKGLWIAPSQTLKVIMPFFVDIYVPYSIKMDEQLSLPVKLFNYVDSCYEIHVKINVNQSELSVKGLKSFNECVCSNSESTVYFKIKPKVIGKLNITVDAVSKYSSYCSSKDLKKFDVEMYDSIRRQLLVEPRGVPTETTFSELICNKNEQFGIVELFSIPEKIVPGSLRSYLKFNGDVMGQTFDNLDQMVKMPYGCGEQNMATLVPSIYVLQYLSGLKIENAALEKKAKEYIVNGYRRQLNYKHDDGSFSAFGKQDKIGSTWLTSFVLRSFSDARKFVAIEDSMLKGAVKYLESMQMENGCFNEKGKLFSSAMAGGVKKSDKTDDSLLTAFVLISLKNTNLTGSRIITEKAVECVISGLGSEPSSYRLALTAFALSIYQPNSKLTSSLMGKLLNTSVSVGRYKYWTFDKVITEAAVIKPVDIETTGYSLLALQTHQTLAESLKTVYWLSSQRNSLGGYYSTQDTVVALNALSIFAEKIGLSNVVNLHVSVDINKKIGISDQITKDNRLVLRNYELGSLNISYVSVKTNGTGCVAIQVISLYNIDKLYSAKETFQLTVNSNFKSAVVCTFRQIKVCFAYLRKDKNSNMILVTANYPTGWQLPKHEMERLKGQIITPLNRIDFSINKMELYYDAMTYNDAGKFVCFDFELQLITSISNLKPALVRIVDYYDPKIYTDMSYSVTDKNCTEFFEKPNDVPKIYSCPTCVTKSEESTTMFMKMICESLFYAVVMENNITETKSRIVYQPMMMVFYEWTLDLEPNDCSCLKTWPNIKQNFVVLSTKRRSIVNEKLILSNQSTMFPMSSVYGAYKSDLFRQCRSAQNFQSMLNRIFTDFPQLSANKTNCAPCILESNFHFVLNNTNKWHCANYTNWKFNVTSVSTKIKGSLKRNDSNPEIHVEAEFPNHLCYCQQQIKEGAKKFRIVDLHNSIKQITNTPNNPIKLILNEKFQIVEDSVFGKRFFMKCGNMTVSL